MWRVLSVPSIANPVWALLFFASSVSSLRAQTPLIKHSDNWRYHKGTSAPQADWKTVQDSSLDATWLSNTGGFGYGDPGIIGEATALSDMENRYTTVYFRRSFTIDSEVDPALHLQLTIDFDDGYVAYLDGMEISRINAPAGTPGNTAVATALHEASCCNAPVNSPRVLDLGAVANRLPNGPHVLAIQGLNETSSSSDFHLIADLSLAPNNPAGVGEVISTDTTWHRADSPVTVVSSIIVNNGVTLMIEAGVAVQFSEGLALVVDGRLLAEGTETDPILLTRAPGASSWGGVTINGDVGSPETRISFAQFAFNGATAIQSSGGTVFLDHLTFAATDHRYVSLDSSSFIVSHCAFPSGTVKFELVHGSGGIKTGGHGIFLRNFFGTTMGYADVVDFTGGSRPGPIVQFIDNVFSGSDDDGIDLDGTDGWIEGNIFMHIHRNGDTKQIGVVPAHYSLWRGRS